MSTMISVKDEVQQLAEKLPSDATWEQAMYELYVRQKIAEGKRAIAEGRVVSHEEVKKRLGLA